jgi:hypothetical protein
MAARKAAETSAEGDAREVTLVGPTGDEITTADAVSANNLIYGMGYKPKTGTTDEAVHAVVADKSVLGDGS